MEAKRNVLTSKRCHPLQTVLSSANVASGITTKVIFPVRGNSLILILNGFEEELGLLRSHSHPKPGAVSN